MLQKYCLFALLLIAVTVGAVASPAPDDKLKPEDIVTKHLAAIGPAETLSAAKSIVAVGDAKAMSHSAAVRDISGVSQLASADDKVILAMVFNSVNYPYEKVGYDGQKMTIALWSSTGQRSALGDFLMSQQVIFKEGLIGGVLSSAWPLRNLAERGAKLSYAGTKKIDDRLVHELKYSPKKGTDLKISLFFDAETFRHVRTEYSHTVSNRMGGRPGGMVTDPTADTGSSTISRYKLTEDFSDFQTSDNLTLPRTYKIRLTIDAQGSQLLEWVMNFKQFAFNQPIEAAAFNVSKTN
jgi:hypothetical protein